MAPLLRHWRSISLLALIAFTSVYFGGLFAVQSLLDAEDGKVTESASSVQVPVISEAGPDLADDTFRNPPNEFRITQYQLTPGTLKKYPRYGIGGVMGFFYSMIYPESNRGNFRLGKDGPSIIGDLVKAAQEIDYKVWLADDWGYPSGMAGGRVVEENPDFEVKGLTMLTLSGRDQKPINYELPEDLHDIVAATLYPVTGGRIDLSEGKPVECTGREIRTRGLNGEWELRIFARYVRSVDVQAQSTMAQFGHSGRYPDLMNREAMGRFIANMHEPILAQIEDPAIQVEGFYANEPNLMQTHWTRDYDSSYACVPWSDGMAEQFERMHGYELNSILPALFEGDDDMSRRSRIHYRQAVAELLTDSFARQVREWCNERGIKSSGHFLLNDYLSMHVQGYGDLMKFVSEFDVPALDIPIPNPDEFQTFPYQQTRFFSSVASWKERDSTIVLLDPIIGGYGLSRLSPGLPLLINSVNMACFHGADHFTAYLPLDPQASKDAKGRDKSAEGYTEEEYTFLNEYTGRLTQVLRGAQREAGVGLYYPIAVFQADLLASDEFWPDIVGLHRDSQRAWDRTEKALIEGDIEYMIVHPEAVAEASISDGHIQIGFGSYHTLVMPQLDFIPLVVAEKLKSFERSGGALIWVDQVPHGAEHVENDRLALKSLKDAEAISVEEIAAMIPESFSPEFDLRFTPGTDQLTVGRFNKDGRQVYLLINRTQRALDVEVKGDRVGDVPMGRVLDPSTGLVQRMQLPVSLQLQANRSVLLIPDSEYLAQDLR
ncbi:MAG: hypothetical protein AAGJ81_04240 [Verrucomicrobiota bacterium]